MSSIIYHHHFQNRVCHLILDNKVVHVDSQNIEKLEHSERVKIVSSNGFPIFNNEEQPLRVGKQMVLSIPQEIIGEYGSPYNMNCLNYSGATLVELNNMESVDLSLYFVAHHVSEERLRKDNERLQIVSELSSKVIDKLQNDMIKAVKTIRGPEKQTIEGLIKNMSVLRDVFVGSDRIRQLVTNESIGGPPWRRYGYGFDYYNRFGNEYSTPQWNRFSQPQQSDEEQEE